MKKIIILVSIFCLVFASCTIEDQDTKSIQPNLNSKQSEKVKAIWITYYELESMTKNSNASKFKKSVNSAIKEIKKYGFNTITVQVRPCADAFYPSQYFPTSIYFNGTQGEVLPYDPFGIICDIAKSNDINVEAWINPYRVSQDDDFSKLSSDNTASILLSKKSTASAVAVVNKKIYFNPAEPRVTKLIVKGVEEIVSNYDISAVHFDDYFYPTKSKSYDKDYYALYQKKGGNLSLEDWRRKNVSDMIKEVYSSIKRINPSVRFGISPAADMDEDRNALYADVTLWMSTKGYIDYICPQIYFGFKNISKPFMFTVKKWLYACTDSSVDFYVGLPLYKSGKADKYAGTGNTDSINEFEDNSNIIARQITYLSKLDDVDGFYIFSYSQLHSPDAAEEVSNMAIAMQNSSHSQD